MPLSLSHDLCFAGFRVDVRAQQLWAGDAPVPLRPRTWQLLVHQLQRPGELVPTESIIEHLWPGVEVTPKVLTNLIGELRRALGVLSVPLRVIETVHRRGYRFQVEITRVPRDAATQPAPAGPPPVALSAGPHFVGRQTELDRLRRRAQQFWAGLAPVPLRRRT